MGEKNLDSKKQKPAFKEQATQKAVSVITDPFEIYLSTQKQDNSDLVELFSQTPSLALKVSQRIWQVKDAVVVELLKDHEMGSLTNFTPIFLALGSIGYFYASSEPNFLILIVTAFAMATGAWRLQSKLVSFHMLVATTLIFVGMSAAKLQVERNQMQIPSSQITTTFTGLVLSLDQNRRGAPRYLLRPIEIDGFDKTYLPHRVRLSSTSKKTRFLPGQTIVGLARLSPVSGPAYPGGYDFAFHAWFKGQGLSGFFMGSPKPAPSQTRPELFEAFEIGLNKFRDSIGQRIKQQLPSSSGAIAVALITGDRSGLSKEMQESLRRSGLAHILAISGLHMALVTLTVVWLVRFLLALPTGLAERYPVKKWGLAAGFLVATGYLFISGGSVATQRAWLMISVMLIAGLLDRRAITMRSVAIAATIILLVFPSSVFEPGFQMSFAAVAALVGFYRSWNLYRAGEFKKHDKDYTKGPLKKIVFYMSGLGVTSLIAGTATALIAAFHFHRVALFGLFTNLAAMPIVSLLVMPLALFTLLLMPYGFEHLALVPLGYSIDLVVYISDFVNARTQDFHTGAKPKSFLILSVAMMCISCISISKLRLLALVPLILLVVLGSNTVSAPDFIISQDGRSVALIQKLGEQDALPLKDNMSANSVNENSTAKPSNNDPPSNPAATSTPKLAQSNQNQPSQERQISFAYPRRNAFIREIWAKAYTNNLVAEKVDEKGASIFECNKDSCRFEHKQKRIVIVYAPDQIQNACETSDILLAPRLWWIRCKTEKKPQLILKRRDFETKGTHAFWLDADNKGDAEIKIKTSWPENTYADDNEQIIQAQTLDQPLPKPTETNQKLEGETNAQYTKLIPDLKDSRRPWLQRFELPKPTSKRASKGTAEPK